MTLFELEQLAGRPRGATKIKDWACWQGCWYVDWGTEESHLASAVVDETTANVLSLEVFALNQAFRWVEPEFKQDYFSECASKEIDPDDSDGLGLWQDVEDPPTIMAVLATITGKV
jgi:hypothetical protein